jgi:hypothetical protein
MHWTQAEIEWRQFNCECSSNTIDVACQEFLKKTNLIFQQNSQEWDALKHEFYMTMDSFELQQVTK